MASPEVTVLRWAARIASLVSLGVLVLFLLGSHFDPRRLTSTEVLLFVFFPLGLAVGMLLGWRREGLGGGIALVSLGMFYAIHVLDRSSPPGGWAFGVLALPAVLFLVSHAVRRSRGGTG